MTDSEPKWYRQALYEQAWENYRNEDDNVRSTVTQCVHRRDLVRSNSS